MKYIFLVTLTFTTLYVKAQNDTIFFKDFGLKAIGKYANDHPEGDWTYFYLNGNKQSSGEYKKWVVV